LCEALSGSNQVKQSGAISALEALGPVATPAVQPLLKLLSSADHSMRYSILRTLGQIGPQARDAVPVLREIAKSNARERA
ncbi:HEAT repeat domain-containing protein, partial [Acinetobacter baumannii]